MCRKTGLPHCSGISALIESIRFVELIVDQLTVRGAVEAGAPFKDLAAGGPLVEYR